ncbi:MAG: hypothetical protein AB7F19_05195 [Candidatus Babeliales bacterium]
MKCLLLCSLFISMQLRCMEPTNLVRPLPVPQHMGVKLWTRSVINCIETRNHEHLQELFENPPTARTTYPLNDRIMEEVKEHRDNQLASLYAPCGSKKIWNKLRAVTIDLGLPLATLCIGLSDGIISGQKVIIALSSIYFVLSLESAAKNAYRHWTMKEYKDKIEEFDVLLQLLQGMKQLQEKGTINQSAILSDTHNE